MPLASCRRQFDNLMALSRMVEDATEDLCHSLRSKTKLPSSLVATYVAILFLNHHHIQLELEHLEGLSMEQVVKSALILIKNWTVGRNSFVIDPILSQDLRDLKMLFANVAEDFWVYSTQKLGLNGASEGTSQRVLETLRDLVQNALSIGCSMGSAKDIRSILSDILLKIRLPLSLLQPTIQARDVFLMASSFLKAACAPNRANPRVTRTVDVFFNGLTLLVTELDCQ